MSKRAHGGDAWRYKKVIDFSANINPLGAPLRLKEFRESIEHYPEPDSSSLKKLLAKIHSIKPDNIAITDFERRQALVRLYRPDAQPDLIRGNVPTRVLKCVEGQYGAVILARAGVERLGLDTGDLAILELDPALWLPAPAQGAVAVEIRSDDERARTAVSAIDDAATTAAVTIERRLLAAFEGGCHTAFGAHAVPSDAGWRTAIGIDRPDDAGWGQKVYEGPESTLGSLGPDNITEMAPLAVETQEALCRPWER